MKSDGVIKKVHLKERQLISLLISLANYILVLFWFLGVLISLLASCRFHVFSLSNTKIF